MRVGQRVVGEPFRSTDCHSQCAHWLRNDGLFARGTVGQRDTWVPPYTALFCRGGRPCPPGSARSLWCVGEGLCPSRGRPRGSPLRRGTRSAVKRGVEDAAPYGGEQEVRYGGASRTPPPTEGNKERSKAGRRGRRPLRRGTRSAVKRGVEDAAPYGGEQEVRYGGRGRTPPLSMAAGCGGACSYGVDRVPVGGNDETSAAVMRLGSSI